MEDLGQKTPAENAAYLQDEKPSNNVTTLPAREKLDASDTRFP